MTFKIVICSALTLLLTSLTKSFIFAPTEPPIHDFTYLIKSVDEVYAQYPERIHFLIQHIDSQFSDLASYKKILAQGDTVEACKALITHFKTVDHRWVVGTLDHLAELEYSKIAQLLEADSVSINQVVDKAPVRAEGGWNWKHLGPHGDAEFAYSLNAQQYLPALYFRWMQTGKRELVERFNAIVQDWVCQHPLPPLDDSIYLVLREVGKLDYRDIGEVEWRTLDTGRRLGSAWPALFFGFIGHPAFSDATVLLMLSSMAEQAQYLQQFHKSGHNWTTMEMNGLALVGLAFPEFIESERWINYAKQIMADEIERQVYPDGMQTEISTKTQWVALRRFESLASHFEKSARPLSSEYMARIEQMYQYLAYCMRPDGHQPLNNDSDREDLRPRVLTAAEKFDRQDWKFIATNGAEGATPAIGPSLTFEHGGMALFRSGWNVLSDWSLFDIGPYGTGHQHRDMLHLSISAFGVDLLVDGGRYTHQNYFSFDPTEWRGYFRSSFSHNVLLVDSQGQNQGPLRSQAPLTVGKDYFHGPEFDFATGHFKAGFTGILDSVEHSRSLLYLKNHIWLVVDQVRFDNPHHISALWHLAPKLQVKLLPDRIVAAHPQKGISLSIIPLFDKTWKLELIKGQESPQIQGWYSPTYGDKLPNTTLKYSAEIGQSAAFAWLIIASDDVGSTIHAQHRFEAKKLTLDLQLPHQKTQISFPLNLDPGLIEIR